MLELGIVCAVSVAAWVYLLVAHGAYWTTGQRLPATSGEAADEAPGGEVWPEVVAVIPARNEAGILPVTLPALLAQDYPGGFRVILVDDRSDDGTGQVATDLAAHLAASTANGGASSTANADTNGAAPLTVLTVLTVLAGQPRPDGWAGKVWAMNQGFAAAQAAEAAQWEQHTRETGEDGYVLFTDADIAWESGALRRLVAAAERDDRALVSQMALLRAETSWEKVVVPAFVYFFAQLYPFRRVNSPSSRTAAGAGGCMLIRRAALVKAGGLEPIRGALIDDVALATLLKRDGNRCWLGLTAEIKSARPYPRLADLWHMIARSAYTQLKYNPALLAGTVIGLLLLYAAPPAGAIAGLVAAKTGAAATGAALAGFAGLAAWAIMTATYLPMLRFYRLSALRAPALPLIAILYAAMTADSARRHYTGRAVSWRGRTADRV
ncbi:MAG: glycosyltransferase [Jatrophihabitantaceae bacterium]